MIASISIADPTAALMLADLDVDEFGGVRSRPRRPAPPAAPLPAARPAAQAARLSRRVYQRPWTAARKCSS